MHAAYEISIKLTINELKTALGFTALREKRIYFTKYEGEFQSGGSV